MAECPECKRLEGRMNEAMGYVTHVASKNVSVKGRFKKEEAAKELKKAQTALEEASAAYRKHKESHGA